MLFPGEVDIQVR